MDTIPSVSNELNIVKSRKANYFMDNKKEVLEKVKTLLQLFRNGEIKTLAVHEVHPDLSMGSRDNYLYFTLPVCINFQRSSPTMWKSALATYEDSQTNYLFYPEKTIGVSREQIQKDLMKHKLALQLNKHTDIWRTISKTLHDLFHDDPREIIALAENDVVKLLYILQISHKKYFPFLSGPKLSNYWPFILSEYSDIQLINPYEISIIPDTHVIKSTIQLGLAEKDVTSLEVVKIWKELLQGSGISPVEVHPVLWNWSRDNFNPSV